MQNTQLAKSMDHIEIPVNHKKENWQYIYINRHFAKEDTQMAQCTIPLTSLFFMKL